MNILSIKRCRIDKIIGSVHLLMNLEACLVFLFGFPPPNRAERIVAIMKTFKHSALDNFFWPELLYSSKQNLLKCGKRTKTIQYILWKLSGEFILLKGFFVNIRSPLIESSMFSVFFYPKPYCETSPVEMELVNATRQISKRVTQGTAQEVDNLL